jgi:hypothetical protein
LARQKRKKESKKESMLESFYFLATCQDFIYIHPLVIFNFLSKKIGILFPKNKEKFSFLFFEVEIFAAFFAL